MITFFGTSYGLLTPILLGAIPLVTGFLMYAYLKRGTGNRVKIASTMLIKELSRIPQIRKRFVPPLRFFIELLMLSLLILGLAGLFKDSEGSRVALIIDNSLSMAARDPQSPSAEPVLELARHEANSILSLLPSDSQVDLLVTSPSPRSLTDGLKAIGSSRELLKKIVPSYSEDRLDTAVKEASTKGGYDRVIVVSDRTASQKSSSAIQNVSLRTVGSLAERSNIALTRAWIEKADDTPRIKIEAISHSKRPADIDIRIERIVFQNNELSTSPVTTTQLSIAPRERGTIAVSTQVMRDDLFKISISPSRIAEQAIDLLAEDNTLWVSARGTGSTIGLVSSFRPDELGLARFPGFTFSAIDPANIESIGNESDYATMVFHRVAPSRWPDAHTLLIMPPKNDLLEMGEPATNLPLTRWNESHALLNYLYVPGLTMPLSSTITPQPWMRDILHTNAGTVMTAGELNGKRYIVTGFEILPYEGRRNPPLTVLTLNIFKWLSATSLDAGGPVPNVPLEVPASSLEVKQFDKIIPFLQGRKSVVPEFPGVVIANVSDGKHKLIPVNFSSEQESNLSERSAPDLPALTSEQGVTRNTLTPTLALIALMIFLLELLLLSSKALPQFMRRLRIQ